MGEEDSDPAPVLLGQGGLTQAHVAVLSGPEFTYSG